MRKSSLSSIAGAAPFAGGGGLAMAQQQRSATSPKLSPNQKTKFCGVVTGGDVRSVDHVNFSRSAGTRGRTAVLHDLPETIVNVIPQYRGFKYMVVHGELIIVDPGTRHRDRSSGLTSA